MRDTLAAASTRAGALPPPVRPHSVSGGSAHRRQHRGLDHIGHVDAHRLRGEGAQGVLGPEARDLWVFNGRLRVLGRDETVAHQVTAVTAQEAQERGNHHPRPCCCTRSSRVRQRRSNACALPGRRSIATSTVRSVPRLAGPRWNWIASQASTGRVGAMRPSVGLCFRSTCVAPCPSVPPLPPHDRGSSAPPGSHLSTTPPASAALALSSSQTCSIGHEGNKFG